MDDELSQIGAALASAVGGATPRLPDEQCARLARTPVNDLLDAILSHVEIDGYRRLLMAEQQRISVAWAEACRRGFQNAETIERITRALDSENTEEQIVEMISGDERLFDSERESLTSIFTRDNQQEPMAAALERSRWHLKSIAVEGFRGIGELARLDFDTGPGLTVVYGMNGSGKSSFVEALDVLLSGDTDRFTARGPEWRDAWHNVHSSEGGSVNVTFVRDGEAWAERTLRRSWSRNMISRTPENASRFDEEPSDDDLDALGGKEAIIDFRPILGYGELGPLFDEPVLSDMERRNEETPLAQHIRRRTGAAESVSEYVAEVLEETRGIDLPLETELDAWDDIRRLANLEDNPWRHPPYDPGVPRLIDSVVPSGAGGMRTDRFPAPGHWNWPAAMTLLDLAHTPGLHKAIVAKVRGVPRDPLPRESRRRIHFGALAGRVKLGAAVGAWIPVTWRRRVSKWSSWGSPRQWWRRHVRLTTKVKVEFSRELSRRQTLVKALRELAAEYRPAEAVDLGISPNPKGASGQLSARTRIYAEMLAEAIYNSRMQSFSDHVARIWSAIRPGSIEFRNVTRASVYRSVTGARGFRTALDFAVDSIAGNERGILSQGELQSLSFCLFLPTMMRPESPFGFAVIDDPVQTMDEYAVDGLAEVLRDTANDLQMIVFTHDERLTRTLWLRGTEHTLINVARSPDSKVLHEVALDPVIQALEDARFTAEDGGEEDSDSTWMDVGIHCREAVEQACIKAATQRLRKADVSLSGIRHELDNAVYNERLTTRKLMALAIFGYAADLKELKELLVGDKKKGTKGEAPWIDTWIEEANALYHRDREQVPAIRDVCDNDLGGWVEKTRDVVKWIEENSD